MATVNKSSLRTEFDALKARFESLCAAGKMSAESRALVDALLMLFELLMAVFMEKHTPKGSANSSLPASQSPNDETARTRPGAKGKGPSLNDARCANTRTRESVRVLAVDACGRCGEDLTDAACTGHQRRTLIDIVFEKVVRHADAQIKHCARCHASPTRCPDRCSTAPASKPTSCTCSSRRCSRSSVSPNRCTPSLDAPSPRPRSSPTSHSSITRWPSGSATPRAPARLTGDARR